MSTFSMLRPTSFETAPLGRRELIPHARWFRAAARHFPTRHDSRRIPRDMGVIHGHSSNFYLSVQIDSGNIYFKLQYTAWGAFLTVENSVPARSDALPAERMLTSVGSYHLTLPERICLWKIKTCGIPLDFRNSVLLAAILHTPLP